MGNKKDWFRILSPCILASLFLLLFMIGSLLWFPDHEGMNTLGVIVSLPLLLAFLLVGVVTKIFIKKTSVLWIAELAIISMAVLVEIIYIS